MAKRKDAPEHATEKTGDNAMKEKSRFALQQVGRRIYELRAEKGMTQDGLAEASGVAQAYISEIENGRGNPSWERISAICHTFGVTFPQLIVDSLFKNVEIDKKSMNAARIVSRLLQEVLEQQPSAVDINELEIANQVSHLRRS